MDRRLKHWKYGVLKDRVLNIVHDQRKLTLAEV